MQSSFCSEARIVLLFVGNAVDKTNTVTVIPSAAPTHMIMRKEPGRQYMDYCDTFVHSMLNLHRKTSIWPLGRPLGSDKCTCVLTFKLRDHVLRFVLSY